MIKIAIIDDEMRLAKKLEGIVSNYMNEEKHLFHIDTFTSGEEFIKLGIKMAEYQIVCLDVRMNGMNGMEVARKIRECDQDVHIIFVTAYMDFSIEGYKVGAIRFILKDDPVFEVSMHEALKEACKKIAGVPESLFFSFKEGSMMIPVDKIVYVESKAHNAVFNVREDSSNVYKKYSIRNRLVDVEEKLGQYGFIRVHKSYLVNCKYIDSMTNYKAYLSDQKVLSIPKNKYREIKNKYIIYKSKF